MIPLVAVAVIIYAVIRLVNIKDKIEQAQKESDRLTAEAEELEKQNEELQYALDHSDDPEVLEKMARDRLGLVMPEDKIYVN